MAGWEVPLRPAAIVALKRQLGQLATVSAPSWVQTGELARQGPKKTPPEGGAGFHFWPFFPVDRSNAYYFGQSTCSPVEQLFSF
jgi:hypothetical protein